MKALCADGNNVLPFPLHQNVIVLIQSIMIFWRKGAIVGFDQSLVSWQAVERLPHI